MNYYNEFDPAAAQWLRNLIAAGLIPAGDVDERSIEDVKPADLAGYTQCHFFAGIGGWPEALRLAGVPDDAPLWTGSCPCQPYSAAGKGGGSDDPRNLWWAFRWLIDQCRPAAVLGEQVASKAGRGWLAGVRADLEALGYAVGAADLCAAGAGPEAEGWVGYEDGSFTWEPVILGAPHIRQRLFWVADTHDTGPQGWQCPERPKLRAIRQALSRSLPSGEPTGDERQHGKNDSLRGRVADAENGGRGEERPHGGGGGEGDSAEGRATGHSAGGVTGGLADSDGERRDGQSVRIQPGRSHEEGSEAAGSGSDGGLADAQSERRDGGKNTTRSRGRGGAEDSRDAGGRADADDTGPQGQRRQPDGQSDTERREVEDGSAGIRRTLGGRRSVPITCADGKVRRIPESVFLGLADGLPAGVGGLSPREGYPLAQGVEGRVTALKGIGNAIVPQVAAEFITSWREARCHY